MTFLTWIYHEQTEGLIFYYDGPKNGMRFMLTEDGRFRASLRSSNFSYLKTLTSGILEPKTWHFVGASYNYVSGECILWIKGSIYMRKVIDWPSELATQQSVIMGAIPGEASNYKGRISCVQLYDRVLTKLEIEEARESCFRVGELIFPIFADINSLNRVNLMHYSPFFTRNYFIKVSQRFG